MCAQTHIDIVDQTDATCLQTHKNCCIRDKGASHRPIYIRLGFTSSMGYFFIWSVSRVQNITSVASL